MGTPMKRKKKKKTSAEAAREILRQDLEQRQLTRFERDAKRELETRGSFGRRALDKILARDVSALDAVMGTGAIVVTTRRGRAGYNKAKNTRLVRKVSSIIKDIENELMRRTTYEIMGAEAKFTASPTLKNSKLSFSSLRLAISKKGLPGIGGFIDVGPTGKVKFHGSYLIPKKRGSERITQAYFDVDTASEFTVGARTGIRFGGAKTKKTKKKKQTEK